MDFDTNDAYQNFFAGTEANNGRVIGDPGWNGKLSEETDKYWIGLNAQTTAGTFVWKDGASRGNLGVDSGDGDTTPWETGYPTSVGDKKCVLID